MRIECSVLEQFSYDSVKNVVAKQTISNNSRRCSVYDISPTKTFKTDLMPFSLADD